MERHDLGSKSVDREVRVYESRSESESARELRAGREAEE